MLHSDTDLILKTEAVVVLSNFWTPDPGSTLTRRSPLIKTVISRLNSQICVKVQNVTFNIVVKMLNLDFRGF